jgi:hypothetical protein
MTAWMVRETVVEDGEGKTCVVGTKAIAHCPLCGCADGHASEAEARKCPVAASSIKVWL